jgi:hypothetical protein
MKDKVFFQFVSITALIALFVFLFWDRRKDVEIGVSGAVFVIAAVLSLLVGRSDASS